MEHDKMPKLIRKTNQEVVNPEKVDEEICQYLGVKCDPKVFYLAWYHTFFFAAGEDDFDILRQNLITYWQDDEDFGRLVAIAWWLSDHYTLLGQD